MGLDLHQGVKEKRRGTEVLWLMEAGVIRVGEEVVGAEAVEAEAVEEGVGEACGGEVEGEEGDEFLKL